jgi:ribosomal subunit interface protein
MSVEIVVRGRHMEVSDRFRTLATDKVARLERFGLDIPRIDVEISKERNPRLAERAIEVELTCRAGGALVRAEAHAGDKYAALDEACDTMALRLRRLADKRHTRKRRHARIVTAEADVARVPEPAPAETDGEESALPPDVVLAEGPVLVRAKTYTTRPMTVIDALDALEALGHDFFFFHDAEADRASVIYRRRGYDYGLIRLDVAAQDGRAAS